MLWFSSVEPWYRTAMDCEECLAGDEDVGLFVAGVDTFSGSVDKGKVLDCVSNGLGPKVI